MGDTGTPSRFWQELAGEHAEQLDRHGPGEIKRNQALRYFTWQWRWRDLAGSEQFRFLLAHSPRTAAARMAFARQSLSRAAWRGLPWGVADRWLYAMATRLLWRYSLEHGDREVLRLGEPTLGNPPPVSWGGRLISQDLANSSLEAEAIRRALGGRIPKSILEIGAGYGRTAYSLLGIFPNACYTIIDIEPALSLSKFYLTALYPDRDISFVDARKALDVDPVDLAVSISSLHEMTPDQVAEYLALLDRVVDGVVYFKQWRSWHNPVDDVVLNIDDYPIPSSWSPILWETAPVQTRFVQAAWATSSGESLGTSGDGGGRVSRPR